MITVTGPTVLLNLMRMKCRKDRIVIAINSNRGRFPILSTRNPKGGEISAVIVYNSPTTEPAFTVATALSESVSESDEKNTVANNG